jgi:hypothetical protein
VQDRPNEWNRDFKATVKYQMPMHIPGVGKLFRTSTKNGVHVREIVSTATLPAETPKSANRRIGIPYKSEE